jgi:hypothetical protein
MHVLHVPTKHTPPDAQALPQPPQLSTFVSMSTQALPHMVNGAGPHTHALFEHVIPVPPERPGASVGTSSADVWRQPSTNNGWAVTARRIRRLATGRPSPAEHGRTVMRRRSNATAPSPSLQ